MFSGKVTKRFIDKFTRKRFEVGVVYRHEDEARLEELHGMGIVEFEAKATDTKKTKGKGEASKENDEANKGKTDSQGK